MRTNAKNKMREVMSLAWQMVKRNGYTMSEALKCAWRNVRLHAAMAKGVVKFYFQKVDGSIREAFGTLAANIVPGTKGTERRQNPTIQTYFDTDRQEWRSFKKANLLSLAI